MWIDGVVVLALAWLLTRNIRGAVNLLAVVVVGGTAFAIFWGDWHHPARAPAPSVVATARRGSPVWEDGYKEAARPVRGRHRVAADTGCIGRQIQDPSVCLLSGPYVRDVGKVAIGYHGIDGLRCGYPVSQCYTLDRELARINGTVSPEWR
jgi:hypothetical protein